MIKFMSLASGSSGNCYYLSNATTAILIDAGIGIRALKRRLSCKGVGLSTICAVLVTHDHADHIKGVGCLGEKYHIPIYATALTHAGIKSSHCVTEKLLSSARTLEKETPLEIGGIRIIPFEVPHDGTDNVGYYIEAEGKRFCFATDVGHITDTVVRYLSQSHYLILEANYDEDMLRTGNYPYPLKQRIAGPRGHLSNDDTATFLSTHYSPEWKHVWLCHLSKDNNAPDIAFETVGNALMQQGIRIGVQLPVTPLARIIPSEMYQFE